MTTPVSQAPTDWVSDQMYPIGSAVVHGGVLYRATEPNDNDEPPSASWTAIISGGGGGGSIVTVSMDLTTNQIVSIMSSPVVLVAAPGASSALNPIAGSIQYLPGTIPFGTGVQFNLTVGQTVLSSASVDLTSIDILVSSFNKSSGVLLTPNAPLLLTASGNPGSGGSILTVSISDGGNLWVPGDVGLITVNGGNITAVNQGAKTFTLDTAVDRIGTQFRVRGSTGNDGIYTVSSILGGVVTVVEAIPNSTADGSGAYGSATLTVDTLDPTTGPITGVNQGTQTFTVNTDLSASSPGDTLTVYRSTGNDNNYTIASVSGSGPTDVVVVEVIPSATADGFAGNQTIAPFGDVGHATAVTVTNPGVAYSATTNVPTSGIPPSNGNMSIDITSVVAAADGTGRVIVLYSVVPLLT